MQPYASPRYCNRSVYYIKNTKQLAFKVVQHLIADNQVKPCVKSLILTKYIVISAALISKYMLAL